MDEEILAKRVLFGELRKRQPCHGMNKRCRDTVKPGLRGPLGVGNGKRWFWLCSEGIEKISTSNGKNIFLTNNQLQAIPFECGCGRSFLREEDFTIHKCFYEITVEIITIVPKSPGHCYYGTLFCRFKDQGACVCYRLM